MNYISSVNNELLTHLHHEEGQLGGAILSTGQRAFQAAVVERLQQAANLHLRLREGRAVLGKDLRLAV